MTTEGGHLVFGITGFGGLVADDVSRVFAANRQRLASQPHLADGTLREMLVRLISLALVIGLLVALRPLYRFATPVLQQKR